MKVSTMLSFSRFEYYESHNITECMKGFRMLQGQSKIIFFSTWKLLFLMLTDV